MSFHFQLYNVYNLHLISLCGSTFIFISLYWLVIFVMIEWYKTYEMCTML